MKVIQVYQTRIDISVADQYKPIDSVVFNILNEKFKNKCFKKSLIVEIKRIINRSALVINRFDLTGNGTIDIVFEAECIVYDKNDLLLCTVANVDKSGIILASSDNIIIKMRADGISEGQIIPVAVHSSLYPINSSKIIINAVLFTPISNYLSYIIPDHNFEHVKDYFSPIITSINELQEELLKLDKKTRIYFEKFLLKENPSANHKLNKYSKVEWNSKLDGIISINWPNVYKYTNFIETEFINPIEIDWKLAYANIYRYIYNYYYILTNMIKTYSTESLISSHSNILS